MGEQHLQTVLLIAIFVAVCIIQQQLKRGIKKMASDLTDITQKVTDTEGTEESAITLITSLAQEIADNKNDPAALQALSDRLNAENTKLAAAVAANPA